MVANKLPATVLAQVFLLVIAGFAVSLYILPTATGTANGILSFHTSNIPCLRCFLFARRLSAYILGHHPKSALGQILHHRRGKLPVRRNCLQGRLRRAVQIVIRTHVFTPFCLINRWSMTAGEYKTFPLFHEPASSFAPACAGRRRVPRDNEKAPLRAPVLGRFQDDASFCNIFSKSSGL
mgnify:CR=1 FL=1